MNNSTQNLFVDFNNPLKEFSETFSSYNISLKKALEDTGITKLQETLNSFINNDLIKRMEEVRKNYLTNISVELQNTIRNMTDALKSIPLPEISKVYDSIDKSVFSSILELAHFEEYVNCSDISNDEIEEMYLNGEITDNDIKSEIRTLLYDEESNNGINLEKKDSALKKIAYKIIYVIVFSLLLNPVTDKVKDKLIESFKISEFWQETGIIDWIDSWYLDEKDNNDEDNDNDDTDNVEHKNSEFIKETDLSIGEESI